jgi:DNA-binding MarR family transcriptional regulator
MDFSKDALTERLQNLEELNTHLTFRISRLSKLLEVEGAARLADSGINLTAYRMLLVIEIFGEISVSDLAKVMLIDRALISRAASDMIERGLLDARSDPASRRKKLLALTGPGRDVFVELRDRFDARQAEVEALLSGESLEGLWSSIDAISRYLEQRI